MPARHDLPSGCSLHDEWQQATYKDCFEESFPLATNSTAVEQFAWMMSKPPLWVTSLMKLRNSIVQFVGLKTDTPNPEFSTDDVRDYKVGDFIGFFKIEKNDPEELIVSTHDSHLNALFSMQVNDARDRISMTSVVRTKRKLGDVYMFVIAPFHRLIVSYLLKRLKKLQPVS